MKVLGIDPGIAIVGYGIVEQTGNRHKVLGYGRITTKAGLPNADRLVTIHEELTKLIKQYKPAQAAVEKLFFSRNTKTAMQVAEARGAIVLALCLQGLSVAEYTPMQVKQAVCGYGGADKNQVQQMVKVLLNLVTAPKWDDTADALAIAICHLQSSAIMNRFALPRKGMGIA